MNTEALRLLEKIRLMADIAELRALLSAQEPTAEHWRQAISEWGRDPVAGGIELEHNLAWIEQRARELAKQEAK